MPILFKLSSLLTMPFWALMILFPRWRWTARILKSPYVIAPAALLYGALVLPLIGTILPAVANPSLSGIAALLSSPAGATIAWVHFLAFDLFVGRWIYLDSRERNANPFLMAPILFLTILLGPIGLLLYLVVRAVKSTRPSSASNRALVFTGCLMLLTLAATLIAMLVDHRFITGAPAWMKPAKFALSITIYCFTISWLLTFLTDRPRLKALIANVTSMSMMVEMTVLVIQAARGTSSHFNVSTPLDSFLWAVMGSFITLAFVAALLLAILLIRQTLPDRAFALSIRMGVAISLVGMALAFLMTRPTPQQMEWMEQGQAAQHIGAHTVGTTDGGPGLPFLGWSTVGGDLRIPHFVGLHALQVMPFLGWLLMRRKGLGETRRSALVWVAGCAYLGFVLILLWQALQGEPLLHPGAATLIAAISLAAATCIAAGTVLLRGRSAQISKTSSTASNRIALTAI
jgi:hypothetical protein